MKCNDYRELFHLKLTGSLDPRLEMELENHLSGCTDCRREFEVSSKIWNLMDSSESPEPSGMMKEKFYTELSAYKNKEAGNSSLLKRFISGISDYYHLIPAPGLAINAAIVILAFFLGFFLKQPGNQGLNYRRQIDTLSSQVNEIKQMMMLSLLDNPSASQRIKAVKFTDELPRTNSKVTQALFTTLNSDPDVNVRLVTLEALIRYASDPAVRQGLVESIVKQDSPVMQVAISEVMVRLSEKRSVPELKKLLERQDLNKFAKQNLMKNLNKLI